MAEGLLLSAIDEKPALEEVTRNGLAARMTGLNRRRLAIGTLALGAVAALTVLVAYPRMFTGFAYYDDEGYMLIALKSFISQGALYDDVFSQYGPFYFEAWGGLFSLFGIPVNHDGGRAVTLGAWVLTSLVLGLSILRITGSIWLGAVVQMLSFSAIVTLVAEPMHPGGIICLLLVAIIAVSSFVGLRISPGAMGLLGGAVAALTLVKINVGAFALAAVALACLVSYPVLHGRRWVRLAIEIAFVLTPVALMAAKLGEAWARDYAAHVSLAALALVVVLRAREARPRPSEELWWLGGGFAATTAAILAAVLASGTSVGGLFDGVIGQPLRQADAFSIRLDQSSRIYLLDLLALAGALAYAYAVGARRQLAAGSGWGVLTGLVGVLVGVEMALSVIGKTLPYDGLGLPAYQLSLLGFAWVALIPAPGLPAGTAFARLLLPPLAVMQALHAYPVAGSQLAWSAFLLIPVGALCIVNGVHTLAHAIAEGRERRAITAFGLVAGLVLTVFIANTTLRVPLRDNRAAREASAPLGLPGSSEVRLGEPDAETYRAVSEAITANCESFVMLPGMNSFYFWTQQDPPTGYNATGWMTLFDESDQQRVIDDTRSIPGLCLLENLAIANAWTGGEIPDGPLVRYLRRGFRPIVAIGDYRLLKREATFGEGA